MAYSVPGPVYHNRHSAFEHNWPLSIDTDLNHSWKVIWPKSYNSCLSYVVLFKIFLHQAI